MHLKRNIVLALMVLLGCAVYAVAQEQITLTTYYPAPSGDYQVVTMSSWGAADRFAVGDIDGSGGLDSADVPANPGDLLVNGNVGIGTTAPNNRLQVDSTNAGGLQYAVELVNASATTGTTTGILFGATTDAAGLRKGGVVYEETSGNGRGSFHVLQNSSGGADNAELADAVLTITNTGEVGIGTTSPTAGATLEVMGDIYVSGTQMDVPDYVFEPAFSVETIEEHAEYMWREKHLKAVPPARVGEDGVTRINVTAYKMGLLEELEKAHIYIEQLHTRLEALEAKMTAQEQSL